MFIVYNKRIYVQNTDIVIAMYVLILYFFIKMRKHLMK